MQKTIFRFLDAEDFKEIQLNKTKIILVSQYERKVIYFLWLLQI